MKRITSVLALAAFLATLAAPLAFAQGSSAPSTTPTATTSAPATTPEKAAPAAKPMAMKHAKAAAMAKCDINSAEKAELMKLPGVGDATADKIIADRPYKTKGELTTKKVVTAKEYAKLRSMIIAKQAQTASATK